MNANNRSKSKSPLGMIIGIVVVIALVLAAAEIGVRMYLGKEFSDGFRESEEARGAVVAEDVETSFGASPVLLALLTRDLPSLEMRTPSTLDITDPRAENGTPAIVGSPATRVTLTDVDLSDSADPVAGHVTAVPELPSDLMIAEANRKVADAAAGAGIFGDLLTSAARLTNLTPHPDRGVLTAEFSGGLATADLRPVVRDGGLAMEIEGASVLGVDADAVIARFADGAATPAQKVGHGFSITDVTVTDTGVDLILEGSGIALSQLTTIEYR